MAEAAKKAASKAGGKVVGKVATATPAGRAAKVATKVAPKVAPKTTAKATAKAVPNRAAPAGTQGKPARSGGGSASGPAPRRSPAQRAEGSKPVQGYRSAQGAVGKSMSIKRALLGEFLLCIVLLGVGAMVLDDPSQTGSHLAIRGSALAGVFLILGLVAAGGDGARKFATAVGLLVTLSYMFAERTTLTKLATWASNAAGGKAASTVGEG